MDEKGLAKAIRQLEKETEHARNLEFEKAAAARDKLFRSPALAPTLHDHPTTIKSAILRGICPNWATSFRLRPRIAGGRDTQ